MSCRVIYGIVADEGDVNRAVRRSGQELEDGDGNPLNSEELIEDFIGDNGFTELLDMIELPKGFSYYADNGGDDVYFGIDWCDIDDFETGKEFKQRVEAGLVTLGFEVPHGYVGTHEFDDDN